MIPKWSIFWSKIFFASNLALTVLLLCLSAPLGNILAQAIFSFLMGVYILWANRYNRKIQGLLELKEYAKIIKNRDGRGST